MYHLICFSFHVSSNWKIAGCIYEALECIKTMAECIGMYLNKNLRKKNVPRERRERQGRDFLGDEIIVSGIKILIVVVALIVELLEDLYCNGYIDAVGKNCRRSNN
jgi:hypothetical protein